MIDESHDSWKTTKYDDFQFKSNNILKWLCKWYNCYILLWSKLKLKVKSIEIILFKHLDFIGNLEVLLKKIDYLELQIIEITRIKFYLWPDQLSIIIVVNIGNFLFQNIIANNLNYQKFSFIPWKIWYMNIKIPKNMQSAKLLLIQNSRKSSKNICYFLL